MNLLSSHISAGTPASKDTDVFVNFVRFRVNSRDIRRTAISLDEETQTCRLQDDRNLEVPSFGNHTALRQRLDSPGCRGIGSLQGDADLEARPSSRFRVHQQFCL